MSFSQIMSLFGWCSFSGFWHLASGAVLFPGCFSILFLGVFIILLPFGFVLSLVDGEF
jgi:hypothetical protein